MKEIKRLIEDAREMDDVRLAFEAYEKVLDLIEGLEDDVEEFGMPAVKALDEVKEIKAEIAVLIKGML